ncbi:MAG: hypothetical protein ACI8RD_009178, partial [Bacillariaceae sp.]|jgi:hypothetical protein
VRSEEGTKQRSSNKKGVTMTMTMFLNDMLEYLLINKDWLLMICFTVDAINTIITFPLIMWYGPKWLLKSTDPTSKEKIDDDDDDGATTSNNNITDLSDTDRKSFQIMWEIFTIAYEGYAGFTISTLICLYRIPETRPIFGYSLFVLYLYKAKSFLMGTFDTKNNPRGQRKLYSIIFFYWPCYGGYCLLHLLEFVGIRSFEL